MVDNKPDTDAPPWCTCQRRDALGPYVPCHLHDVTSDAPQEGRPTGCSECTDWFTNPLNPQPVDEAHPWCPIRDTACVRFPDAVRPEGRPTTPQTEASRCFWRGRQTGCECHAIIEAAAGALPSVDGALLAQYWFEDWSGERFSNLEDQRLWLERGSRVAARLAAAPPEASE
jgi:hypothetical protein